MGRREKLFPVTALVLVVLQIATVLFSWIVSSVSPTLPYRSLLSSDGLRWFFGSFVDNISCPLLTWLILIVIAYGAYVHSGLKSALITFRKSDYRQRHALSVAIIVGVVIMLLFSIFSFVPHAILLGVSGGLFPSPFSSVLIPALAFILVVSSVVYGLACGRYSSVTEIFRGLYAGFYIFAPIFPVYVLAVQLYYSVRYILIM